MNKYLIGPRFLSGIRWIGPPHLGRDLSKVGIIVILGRGQWWIIGILLRQLKEILGSQSESGMVRVGFVEIDMAMNLVQPGAEHVLDVKDLGIT